MEFIYLLEYQIVSQTGNWSWASNEILHTKKKVRALCPDLFDGKLRSTVKMFANKIQKKQILSYFYRKNVCWNLVWTRLLEISAEKKKLQTSQNKPTESEALKQIVFLCPKRWNQMRFLISRKKKGHQKKIEKSSAKEKGPK